MSSILKIHARGGLGNRMFQQMFATELDKLVPGLKIYGVELPEWGWASEVEPCALECDAGTCLKLSHHRLDIGRIAAQLRDGSIQCFEYDGWACRLEYYDNLSEFRDMFATPSEYEGVGFPEDVLLVNVRAAEILKNVHQDYVPLPIGFIDSIVRRTGLSPVFMGQLGADWYSNNLREKFSDAEFVPSQGAIKDFEIIRQSVHVVIPVSTFSWLASWLSVNNQCIHMPMLGIFNPLQRPDTNFLPIGDSRYIFYRFPYFKWNGDVHALENLRYSVASQSYLRLCEKLGILRGYVSSAKGMAERLLSLA
ncbi:hypothetical protein G3480_20295 [Thiorhodococcus mannitoliphagus]|uniref:Glycosyl transferase n=1 Tax=Thiorhodococcus mannitoliphagus TaxID=329406 RepID=A0A6P1DWC9_9GAMM|nr:hypothetical protein [Thiorhodococcus mannitoliphagus]NEX22617.1 hypothetical protein [Thiorhodococcus mannitoliphagus]